VTASLTTGTVRANGVELHVTEAGSGPLVLLLHGFPELGLSWRHQLEALAAAGYHAVAPDQRGYGASSAPPEVGAYGIRQLVGDVVGLIDAYGADRAAVVGHDWGAPVAWHTALLAPERVAGVAGLSVAYVPRPPAPPTAIWRRRLAGVWFYILYFQEPGVAEADLGRDPALTLRRMYGGLAAGHPPADPSAAVRDGRGMVERLPEIEDLPAWLDRDDFEVSVASFARTGFTGALNWYRNFDANWEDTADLDGARVEVPAAFVVGAEDPVLAFTPADDIGRWVPDLRVRRVIDGAGHWVNQERPDEVNAALLELLGGLDLPG
jgi:pimeloyl-ACP methyl ester carboxylesterase